MTKEDAIRSFEIENGTRRHIASLNKHHPDYQGYLELIERNEMAISALSEKWIPVSEGLPEKGLAVLVWCPERKNIYCAYYEEKQWWIFGAYFEKITLDIVAWRPLPEPYKGDE